VFAKIILKVSRLFVVTIMELCARILEKSLPDITTAEIQEAGEDLGILLGQCLEAKIRGKRILDILKDLG
jgi:hypothetical protein